MGNNYFDMAKAASEARKAEIEKSRQFQAKSMVENAKEKFNRLFPDIVLSTHQCYFDAIENRAAIHFGPFHVAYHWLAGHSGFFLRTPCPVCGRWHTTKYQVFELADVYDSLLTIGEIKDSHDHFQAADELFIDHRHISSATLATLEDTGDFQALALELAEKLIQSVSEMAEGISKASSIIEEYHAFSRAISHE